MVDVSVLGLALAGDGTSPPALDVLLVLPSLAHPPSQLLLSPVSGVALSSSNLLWVAGQKERKDGFTCKERIFDKISFKNCGSQHECCHIAHLRTGTLISK